MSGGIWQKASNMYSHVLTGGDPRTQSWFLVHSPLPTLLVVALYLLVVKYGPRFMANRKPAGDLRKAIIIYNFTLVIWSVYMFYEFTAVAILQRYSWICQHMDLSNNWLSLRIAECFWWYYFSKIVELLDTMFFILRKKFGQVSFLHVYHHSTMPILMWLCVKYYAGGNCFIVGILNSLIHIFMYGYYALSALGPHMHKYLWWKPYLTIAQLVQLGAILIHSLVNRYVDCKSYPYQYNYLAIVYCSSLIGLFANFYYRAYYRTPSKISSPNPTKTIGDSMNTNGKSRYIKRD
ncbi:unnamed protein product [Gordionus sp. m RMFG-2023]|uniref:very long chain fatty acid elongase 4-like n=1 Tax=Gordionus sp. m RMFG-2023 TaxID=3053472 RepID=UPI0030E06F39